MVSGRHYLGLVCHRDTIAAAADLHIPPCTQSYRTSGYICTGEDTGVDTGRSRSGHRLGVGVTPKLGAPPQAVVGPPRKSPHLRPTLELWGITKFAGEGWQILCELYDTLGLVLGSEATGLPFSFTFVASPPETCHPLGKADDLGDCLHRTVPQVPYNLSWVLWVVHGS